MTASKLFKAESLNETINCDLVVSLSIDLLSEFALLEREISDYLETEAKLSKQYEEDRNKITSHKLPSIVNLESRCETIFQKTYHIEQTLMEITAHFYPKSGIKKNPHFPSFHLFLQQEYGEQDCFTEFVGKASPFMKVIRELRNKLDHRNQDYRIVDFEMRADGSILSPTIELNSKRAKLERTALSEFLELTTRKLVEITEVTFASLAARAVKTGGVPLHLREIPKERRQNEFVRFGFWMPIDVEGFYRQ